MKPEPKFFFGTSYAVFFRVPSANVFQKHVAFQVLLGIDNDIHVFDSNNQKYSGPVVLIKPLAKSKVQCEGHYTLLFLSPTLSLTSDLINLSGKSDIHILQNTDRLPINITSSTTPDDIINHLNALDKSSVERLDPRLAAVLDYLNQNLENPSILEAAKHSGLSRSRVRTLAREQIGIPLSTWVMWRKVVKANKALSHGANLSDAALAGHFADHAHFSRTMKRMFGVTPTQASRAYT